VALGGTRDAIGKGEGRGGGGLCLWYRGAGCVRRLRRCALHRMPTSRRTTPELVDDALHVDLPP
jgi:hypothetical protein